LKRAEDLGRLQTLGFRGFLIGEALMRAADPEAALRDFIAGAKDGQAAMASDTVALQF
jgi:hypothetical protein